MSPADFDNPVMIRTPRALARLVPATGLVLGLSGCVLFQHPEGITVSSDPPGASVLVGQRDSGFVTPCVLAFDPHRDERVDLVLRGYQPETRYVTPDHEVYAILWREMSVEYRTWDFPLFLNLRDFVVPVKVRSTCSPGRIHVRLDRTADAPAAAKGVAVR